MLNIFPKRSSLNSNIDLHFIHIVEYLSSFCLAVIANAISGCFIKVSFLKSTQSLPELYVFWAVSSYSSNKKLQSILMIFFINKEIIILNYAILSQRTSRIVTLKKLNIGWSIWRLLILFQSMFSKSFKNFKMEKIIQIILLLFFLPFINSFGFGDIILIFVKISSSSSLYHMIIFLILKIGETWNFSHKHGQSWWMVLRYWWWNDFLSFW